jgi:hypothetical protein
MKSRITFLFYLAVVFLLIVSCGISKSLKHQPLTSGYDQTIPVVDKKAAT